MKMLKKAALVALLGLFSLPSFAEEKAAVEATQAEQAMPAQEMKAEKQVNTVNINTASAAELQDKLVGVGAKKAQAIVEYREKHGAFSQIEQLLEVSGIGKGIFSQNKERLRLE